MNMNNKTKGCNLNLLEFLVSNDYITQWEADHYDDVCRLVFGSPDADSVLTHFIDVEDKSIDELVDLIKAEQDTDVPSIDEINGV